MSNSQPERFSPLLLARVAGIVGLLGIVAGAFDIGYVHGTLVVAGNPAATLHNILAHEALFRLGFSAHLCRTAAEHRRGDHRLLPVLASERYRRRPLVVRWNRGNRS
ncbi:MAG: DUF4386 family protein [Candidatus Korobacteraceae bacterium]